MGIDLKDGSHWDSPDEINLPTGMRSGALCHINRLGPAYGMFEWCVFRSMPPGGDWILKGAWITYQEIADDLKDGVTKKQVRDWLRRLVKAGYVEIETSRGRGIRIKVTKNRKFAHHSDLSGHKSDSCDLSGHKLDEVVTSQVTGNDLSGHKLAPKSNAHNGKTPPKERKERRREGKAPLNPDRWRDVCIELKGESIGEHWLLQWMTQCRGDTTKLGMLKQLLGASRADMYTVARRAVTAWFERKQAGQPVNAMYALEKMVEDLILIELERNIEAERGG